MSEKENSLLKNEDGFELFIRTIVIEDEDKRKGCTSSVLESWRVIFTENDEDSIVKAQMTIAENTVKQITRYIECYQLLQKRADIAAKQLEVKGPGNTDLSIREKLRMNDVQNQLHQYDAEYRTIMKILHIEALGIDDISGEWIAEKVMNAELMCQSALLDNTVG